MKATPKKIELSNATPLLIELASQLSIKHSENGNGWNETDDIAMAGFVWSAKANIEVSFKRVDSADMETPPEDILTDLSVIVWGIECTDMEGSPVEFELLDDNNRGIGDDELKKLVEQMVTDNY